MRCGDMSEITPCLSAERFAKDAPTAHPFGVVERPFRAASNDQSDARADEAQLPLTTPLKQNRLAWAPSKTRYTAAGGHTLRLAGGRGRPPHTVSDSLRLRPPHTINRHVPTHFALSAKRGKAQGCIRGFQYPGLRLVWATATIFTASGSSK